MDAFEIWKLDVLWDFGFEIFRFRERAMRSTHRAPSTKQRLPRPECRESPLGGVTRVRSSPEPSVSAAGRCRRRCRTGRRPSANRSLALHNRQPTAESTPRRNNSARNTTRTRNWERCIPTRIRRSENHTSDIRTLGRSNPVGCNSRSRDRARRNPAASRSSRGMRTSRRERRTRRSRTGGACRRR